MPRNGNYARSIFVMLVLFGIVLLCTVLKTTASFVLPLTFALLLSFVFYPFCKGMKKLRVPWLVSIIIILAIAIVVIYFIVTLLVTSLQTIIEAYPRYEARFTSIYKTLAVTLKLPFDEDLSLFSNIMNSLNIRGFLQNIAISLSTSLVSFSKVFLMIVLLVIFLLMEFNTMKLKFNVAFTSAETHEKILRIVRNTIAEVTHYISIKFLISLATGLLVTLGTSIVKMDFPVIWGFLAFILNFIPNFGSIISCLVTGLFALLQFYPRIGHVVYVFVMVLSVNMILGNFVEPRWEGRDLGLSPFIILVSLSLWGYIWGFVGMILAVPMTVIIKIICENVESLRPVAIMIGGNPGKLGKQQEESGEAVSKASEL
ncbi:MAG: AI-2E family transporter [Treponema sp.]|nr:AI-2E family transporter [Treponema sp.]